MTSNSERSLWFKTARNNIFNANQQLPSGKWLRYYSENSHSIHPIHLASMPIVDPVYKKYSHVGVSVFGQYVRTMSMATPFPVRQSLLFMFAANKNQSCHRKTMRVSVSHDWFIPRFTPSVGSWSQHRRTNCQIRPHSCKNYGNRIDGVFSTILIAVVCSENRTNCRRQQAYCSNSMPLTVAHFTNNTHKMARSKNEHLTICFCYPIDIHKQWNVNGRALAAIDCTVNHKNLYNKQLSVFVVLVGFCFRGDDGMLFDEKMPGSTRLGRCCRDHNQIRTERSIRMRGRTKERIIQLRQIQLLIVSVWDA